MTWADLALECARWAAIIAVPIAGILGLLSQTLMRSVVIWLWALLPLPLELVMLCVQPLGVAVFLGAILMMLLPFWAGFSALSFIFVVRLREFSGGNGYGSDR